MLVSSFIFSAVFGAFPADPSDNVWCADPALHTVENDFKSTCQDVQGNIQPYFTSGNVNYIIWHIPPVHKLKVLVSGVILLLQYIIIIINKQISHIPYHTMLFAISQETNIQPQYFFYTHHTPYEE